MLNVIMYIKNSSQNKQTIDNMKKKLHLSVNQQKTVSILQHNS